MKARFAPLFLLVALAACEEKKEAPATTTAATASAAPATSAAAAVSAAPSKVIAAPQNPLPPADYEIDTTHSRLGFTIRHMMVSNVRGQFTKWNGAAHIDEANLAASNVNIDVDIASIDTAEPKRDTHLKSPDFFDAAKFPKMTFKSTSIARSESGYKVTGDLTIRDVTKPVTLDVDALSPEQKDPWGGLRRGTHATAKINRKDFGLTWNKAIEGGGVLVGDDVNLDLEIELTKKVAK